MNNWIGKEVIVRADKAGVFFGTLLEKNDNEVKLGNCRKLFHWSGAAAVEQIAKEGVKYPDDCKFTVWVTEMVIFNVEQILPCTSQASQNIKSVKEWKI